MNLKTSVIPRYRSPAVFRPYPELTVAESTRHGGVSLPPFQSLNLGRSTKDNPEHVAENRQLFWNALKIPARQVASSHQVHGDLVLVTDQPGDFKGYDAIITHTPDIFLAVTVADCTPVLIYDPVGKVVAAIHAGWRGTVSRIVSKTIEKMTETFGSLPENCQAYVGTCIDFYSFEVGEEVALHFEDRFKTFDAEKQKFFVDLKAVNKQQLLDSGVKEMHIQVSAYSTVLDNQDYFSYRLEKGQTGRMLAVIGFRSER